MMIYVSFKNLVTHQQGNDEQIKTTNLMRKMFRIV